MPATHTPHPGGDGATAKVLEGVYLLPPVMGRRRGHLCGQSAFPVRGRLSRVLTIEHPSRGRLPGLSQQNLTRRERGASPFSSDQSHIPKAGLEGRGRKFLARDWLMEMMLSTNEEVQQHRGAGSGSPSAFGNHVQWRHREAEKRGSRTMAAGVVVVAAAAARARILQASDSGAEGSRS